ncbi:MAG: porphobilinogen deaminase [Thermoleophilia bacterium]|nr:porphobilinogen deaminase [Thermoleophilia bacterium]
MTTLRLGTRRSPLALHQANLVRDAVRAAAPDLEVELVEMTSDGDLDPRELREIGERGIFAHTLERALLAGSIDAAVHSSKDLALEETAGLELVAWLPREDPRDALVGAAFQELVAGSTVATGSARRSAALHTAVRGVQVVPIRGNVQTRIERSLARGDTACMLAMAGLTRLGITELRDDVHPVPVEVVVPEAGQGAVVVQATAATCPRTGFGWHLVDHVATRRAVALERGLARRLGGGCEHPVGVHALLDAGRILAFAAPSPDEPGTIVAHDLLGLELATLLSTSSAADVEDAADHAAAKLAPVLAQRLGLGVPT